MQQKATRRKRSAKLRPEPSREKAAQRYTYTSDILSDMNSQEIHLRKS